MSGLTQTATPVRTAGGDSARGIVHSIGIAGLKTVTAPDAIRTVLGSCIGIAIYDTSTGVGSMGHVILPDSKQGTGDPGKFADTAVEILVNEASSAGAVRTKLRAKIAGGAAMFGNDNGATLGDRNADAVRAMLKALKIPLIAEDVGGTKGRKMSLNPATGEVLVEIIGESARTI
jgi:chemotaxis protein CheD